MQVRENFAMDAVGTTFTSRKTYTISRFTLIFLAAISLCTIIAAGLLIYNFATCPEIQVQSQVCESKHVIPITHTSESNVLKPSTSHTFQTSNKTTSHEHDKIGLRLPDSVIPISYNIKIIPFLFEHNFTFNGEVKIVVNVTKQCQNITLHATALKIKREDVKVYAINGNVNSDNVVNGSKPVDIRGTHPIEQKQFFIIEFNNSLVEGGLYMVHIKYIGILNDQLQGFYRSAYSIGNETRYVHFKVVFSKM